MEQINLIAPCLFGTESIAADEFRRMGFTEVVTENGRVKLAGDCNMLARANICSRFAERILINVGEFYAATFTELFDGVKVIGNTYALGSLNRGKCGAVGGTDNFPVLIHNLNGILNRHGAGDRRMRP